MNPNWYCVRTNPRRESVAAESLRSYGIPVLSPLIRTYQRTKYRNNQIIAPLFPSYIFANLDLENHYYQLRRVHGVHSLVGFDDAPYQVASGIIQEIQERMIDGFVRLDDRTELGLSEFKPSQKVQIVDGAFFGHTGVFLADKKGQERVVILLDALGGARVEIEREYVEPFISAAVCQATARLRFISQE